MNDPTTILILGGAAVFLVAAVLAALVGHLTLRFERKLLSNHWHVLRTREQMVTSREYQALELERDLAQKARDRNLMLGQRAHDAYSMVQATLAQIDDDTVVDVLKWEEL